MLGAAPRPTLLARLAAIEAALGLAPDAVLRLAALAVEVAGGRRAPARPPAPLQRRRPAKLLRAGWCSRDAARPSGRRRAARVYLYRHGQRPTASACCIGWARAGEPPKSEAWRRRCHLPERWQRPRFPLKGADVLALGVPAGPRVGEILRALEERWIAGGFAADEAALRARLEDLVGKT